MTNSLSIGVPMDLTVTDSGYVVLCEKIPMLLAGNDVSTAREHVARALTMVADYLLTQERDDAKAYLRRRGADFSFGDTNAATPEERTFRFGGGVLAHA
jgi:hypothetical protein